MAGPVGQSMVEINDGHERHRIQVVKFETRLVASRILAQVGELQLTREQEFKLAPRSSLDNLEAGLRVQPAQLSDAVSDSAEESRSIVADLQLIASQRQHGVEQRGAGLENSARPGQKSLPR